MEEELKLEVQRILEQAVLKELGTPRVIKAWDGTPKSVSGRFGPYSSNMIASGELYDSVFVYLNGEMSTGDFEINVSFSPNDYWYYLQNGRQPGQEIFKTRTTESGKTVQYKSYTKIPPLESIKGWLRDKPVTQYRNQLGQFLSRDTQAYLIGRAIARDGQYPYDFLGLALEDAKPKLLETLQKYAETVFGGLIIKNLRLDFQ